MRVFWSGSTREVQDGEITKAQREALDSLRQSHGLTDSLSIQPEFGGDAVLLDMGGFWVGIEPDGYPHSDRYFVGGRN